MKEQHPPAPRAALLSKEEEAQLVAEMHAGSTRGAFDRLVRSQQGLVNGAARQYANFLRSQDDLEDLKAAGTLGLTEAITRFDPSRGVRLVSYASHYVHAWMRRYTLENRSLVGSPKTRAGRRLISGMSTKRRELEQALGRPPTKEELAAAFDAKVADVEMVAAFYTSKREEEVPVEMSASTPSPEDLLSKKEETNFLLHALNSVMRELPEREQAILQRRFTTEERVSLNEVGAELGLSRERVRQLEAKALSRLRERFHQVPRALRAVKPAPVYPAAPRPHTRKKRSLCSCGLRAKEHTAAEYQRHWRKTCFERGVCPRHTQQALLPGKKSCAACVIEHRHKHEEQKLRSQRPAA